MPYQYIHLAYLDQMAGDDSETRGQLLHMLIEDMEHNLPEMKALLQKQEWQALQNLSHHLKSTLVFAGNAEMARANRSIEKHLTEEPEAFPDFIALQIDAMETLLPMVLTELKREFQKK